MSAMEYAGLGAVEPSADDGGAEVCGAALAAFEMPAAEVA